MNRPQLILASRSPSRRMILESAGLDFDTCFPDIDEAPLKDEGKKKKWDARTISMRLAVAKASTINHEDAYIIGADQILEYEGLCFDKPAHVDEALHQLRHLRGQHYRLWTSVCLMKHNDMLWQHHACSVMKMRLFGDDVLADYVEKSGDVILSSPGACLLDGMGVQLLESYEGDYFSVLGLPLFPLLEALRSHHVLGT